MGFTIIDVFSDSVNAIELVLDPMHHTAHKWAANVLAKLAYWLTVKPDASITLHHTPKACELREHVLAHEAASNTEVPHGEVKHTSLAKARADAVTRMTDAWSDLAKQKSYIGAHFLPLHEGSKQLLPSHLKGGTWIGKVSTNTSDTVRLAQALMGHAPIGAYRQRFLKEKETYECNCGLGKETIKHVFRHCPLHQQKTRPGRKLTLVWVSNFLHDNPAAFGVFREPRLE